MSQLVESIVNKNYNVSKELFEQHMEELVQSKLNEVKKMIAARMNENDEGVLEKLVLTTEGVSEGGEWKTAKDANRLNHFR